MQRRRWSDYRYRARQWGVAFDPSVTLPKVLERDGGFCHLCEGVVFATHLEDRAHPYGPTIDHLVPMSLGGSHTWDNVALAHHRCNSLKGNRIPVAG